MALDLIGDKDSQRLFSTQLEKGFDDDNDACFLEIW